MEVSMTTCACILMCMLTASAASFRFAESAPTFCHPREFKTFIYDLNSQCPLSISSYSSPIQVDGELLESVMSTNRNNVYTAVLYFASWCPFSSMFQSKFSTLCTMYPEIKHLVIEQSSAVPSVFSRYGIHSVPSLLMVSQMTRIKYHGQRDLKSLVNFYKRTTGLDPVVNVVEDNLCSSESDQKVSMQNGGSLKETVGRELYLLLATIFVLSRASLYFFPEIFSRFTSLWVICIPHFNMGIFGESRQLLGRIVNLIDLKRIWGKLKLCKTRNFHNGARNAGLGIFFGVCLYRRNIFCKNFSFERLVSQP